MLSSESADTYFSDASGFRGTAADVFVPANLDEVRATAIRCRAQSVPLTVAGAGTGLTGARVPAGGAVLSLERFRNLEIHEGWARCGAAVSLSELHSAATATRQFFGPNPTEISASLGGVFSTNAGGARTFRYGSVRQHVLAAEVTFMSGHTQRFERGERVDFPYQCVRRPATTKNSAGYLLQPDLEWVDLLAGSEGTLAIVTEVDVKLLPEPPAILGGVVFFGEDGQAVAASEAWREVAALRMLEYLDSASLDMLRPFYSTIPPGAKAALLIEQDLRSELDEEVDRWPDRLAGQQAYVEESWFGFRRAEREEFRRFRHLLAATVTDRARKNGFPKYGTDFAVPLERLRELHAHYRKRCGELFPDQFTIFGHIGDANNHVNLLPSGSDRARRCADLIHEFAALVLSMGGTIAAEHGIGKTKVDLFELMYTAGEIESMRTVKSRLDPHWLLGRGTMFRS